MTDKDHLSLDEQIRRELEIVNGEDYNIRIDIISRSRELAGLYLEIKEIDKAIEIYRVFIDFCQELSWLDNPHYIYKDIDVLVELYLKIHKEDKAIELLNNLITQYPEYTNITIWKKRLKSIQKNEL